MISVPLYLPLIDLVMKDTFTLLYNKQYLNERLPVFIQKAQESHYPLSLALMDIDLFKNVNDTFGHLFGDKSSLRLHNS